MCPRSQQGRTEPRQKPWVPTARPHTPPASLGSCLRGERHEAAGRVEDVERAAGLGVPGYPGDILGEAANRHLEQGPENSGERSGLEKAAPETSQEEEARLLRDKQRELLITCLWAGCDLQTADIRLFGGF